MTLHDFNERVESLGGKLYLVGGAVRDSLLGREPADRDFVFTGVRDIRALGLGSSVGKDFPVFIVDIDGEQCEVAAARTERSTGPTDKDFDIDASASVTIDEDLMRRDLTINAMAIQCHKVNEVRPIIDPSDGLGDLMRRTLRHTGSAFKEDPCRVFRLARFAAQFSDFEVAYETEEICRDMRFDLKYVPSERVFKEMSKALVAKKPSRFFEQLSRMDCLMPEFFGEIIELHVPDRHNGTAFNHTMKCIDYSNRKYLPIQFGLLCHDLGKGRTSINIHPSHHGHDALGIAAVNNFCDRLNTSNDLREVGVSASRDHMKMKLTREMKAKNTFKFLMSCQYTSKIVNEISYVDGMVGQYRPEGEVNALYKHNERLITIVDDAQEQIRGKHLIEEGMKSGPALGKELYDRRLSYFKTNRGK